MSDQLRRQLRDLEVDAEVELLKVAAQLSKEHPEEAERIRDMVTLLHVKLTKHQLFIKKVIDNGGIFP